MLLHVILRGSWLRFLRLGNKITDRHGDMCLPTRWKCDRKGPAMKSTRRSFLKTAGASLTAVATGAFGPRATVAAETYGGLRMGIQSYSLRHFPFDEAMDKVAELGLHYVELYPGHLDHNQVTEAARSEAIKRMEGLGIVPDAYGVVGFDEDEAAARKIFDFAKRLGLRSISADPTPASFDMLDKLVDEYQIPIAIHNHGPHHRWGKPEAILEAVKDHHKLIGLCADTGHFLRADVDPVKAVKLLRGRVYGLHVKDFISENEEVIAGDGKLDLKALIAEVRTQNFVGACSIEFELSPEDPMAGIRAGLANVREAVSSLA